MNINVVLYNPEIPQNTGNIMRSCVGFNATLHLIKPLGFSLEDKYLKRSALDYLKHLNYIVYEDYEDFLSKNKGTFYFLSRYASKTPKEMAFNKEDNIYLIFGKESTGIPYDILNKNIENTYRIPTTDKIRSLNLSNCVCLMLYLTTSANDFDGLITHEPDSLKGEDFLNKINK